jgi:hypothetical protein
MKIFVLGAGASKSYSTSPTGVRMPVARDFFETFDRLKISGNTWVLQEGLIGYLESKGVANVVEYLRSGIDIEELHSKIGEDLTKVIGSDDVEEWIWPYKAYNELVFLFTSVINEIQNGPISNSHRKIARLLRPDDAVITFNWDTLMDRALEAETTWTVDSGYMLRPRGVFDLHWRAPREAGRQSLQPALMKLHGSTNWLTAYVTREQGHFELTHTLDPSTVYVYRNAQEPYACFAGRFMSGYQPFSYGYYPPNLQDAPARAAPLGHVFIRIRSKMPTLRPEGKASQAGLVSMPLIIPPVKQKSYELFGSLFGGLWAAAEEALAKSEEIIVIGYSFPRTDLRSHALFAKAFSRRTTMPRITIIDPSPERAVVKFRSDLGIAPDLVRVLPEPFTESIDLAKLLECD